MAIRLQRPLQLWACPYLLDSLALHQTSTRGWTRVEYTFRRHYSYHIRVLFCCSLRHYKKFTANPMLFSLLAMMLKLYGCMYKHRYART
jgi:hypothetical protein